MTDPKTHHYPEGPWYQPDGRYAGLCRCGFQFEGRCGGEAEGAWMRHYEAALASPSPDTPEKRMLLDLLAVIHRDGGQHTGEHGLAASVADAMLLSSERLPDTPEIEGRGQ